MSKKKCKENRSIFFLILEFSLPEDTLDPPPTLEIGKLLDPNDEIIACKNKKRNDKLIQRTA